MIVVFDLTLLFIIYVYYVSYWNTIEYITCLSPSIPWLFVSDNSVLDFDNSFKFWDYFNFKCNILRILMCRCEKSNYSVYIRAFRSNPGGEEIFRPSRLVLGPTQPPVQWVLGLSRG